ncbi:MAG TPA: UvrD-helicase domain-containing protein, partial [Rhizomicrobium sp.]|nr:UvrD-helicase domain-containing protein [Rhizomicrobium sp.]
MSDPSITAADPKQSAWVAANAGAGKTYTLANRVTRLLLDDTDPEKILCLTYTKAAAAEMQARLFKQLGEWSMLPNKVLEQNVRAIGADLGGPEDMKKARRLFAKALETPGGLKILTIHAFCQNLLSRFPLEAGVPAAFTVLDDQTARELITEARARVLERAGSGDAPRAAAVGHLVTQTSEQTLNSILDAALGSDRRKLDRFLEQLAEEDTALAVRRAHGADEERDAAAIATAFGAAFKSDPRMLEMCEWLHGAAKNTAKAAAQLAAAYAMSSPLDAYAEIREALFTDAGASRKLPVSPALAAMQPELAEAFTRLQSDFADAENARRAAHAASLVEAAIVVARAMREEYARAKKARGALDYDDLINETV